MSKKNHEVHVKRQHSKKGDSLMNGPTLLLLESYSDLFINVLSAELFIVKFSYIHDENI